MFLYIKISNIGIIRGFSCINICRIPRKLFEHETNRPSVKTFQKDPANVNTLNQLCMIVILAIYVIP